MKTITIDKTVLLDAEFDSLEDVSCREKIQVTAKRGGLECTGVIEIKGTGLLELTRIPVHELIDLSVFAPFEKLSESEQFGITLKDYQLEIDGNELLCKFIFEVSGIIDELSKEDNDASLEDLLDDSETVKVKKRYVLTYNSDTYSSIASRYHVSEKELRSLNQNKTLSGRTLIVIP